MIFLPVQCRMARAALGWGLREFAAAAKVSIDTVARFERGDELKERTIDALQRALEAAGVEFTNSDQPGVRLDEGRCAVLRQARQRVKTNWCGESSPRQIRQDDREKTIGTALRSVSGLRCHRWAFELAGVEFIDENGGGPGVRLRKRQPKKG